MIAAETIEGRKLRIQEQKLYEEIRYLNTVEVNLKPRFFNQEQLLHCT